MPADLRPPLLISHTAEDVEMLAGSGLAPVDVAVALCIALKNGAAPATAARRLALAAGGALFTGLCRQLESWPAPAQEAALRALLKDCTPQTPQGLDRLLRQGLKVSADVLARLLDECGLCADAWQPFWDGDGRLDRLLGLLSGPPASLHAIWSKFSLQLTGELLVPGDARQRKLLAALARACDQMESRAVEEAGAVPARINAWRHLRQHLDDPVATEVGTGSELQNACQLVGMDASKLLADLRDQMLTPGPWTAADSERLLALTRGFFPWDANARQMIKLWPQLVKPLPDDFREGAYELWLTCEVPATKRLTLARQMHEVKWIGDDLLARLQLKEDEAGQEAPPASGIESDITEASPPGVAESSAAASPALARQRLLWIVLLALALCFAVGSLLTLVITP